MTASVRKLAAILSADVAGYSQLMAADDFIEVFVDTPLELCEERDPKGLYKKARAGEIPNFTGVSDPYEAPENPELVIKTAECSLEETAVQLLIYLEDRGKVPPLAD